ncbi:aspartate kinase [Clostridium formicaceticum]|uniref:Aspartokinase n=1 Tax=Clostridium formicaceticum TaxID=1497 RepID=A0AAC9RJI9_9CLOT|nr:aspartate kinase [Clostridium formicaceticum]AOY76300.1 aspartate kinase [Clostridium formicaceticum]ARE86687.1 Aspartokinase 2 [Clostridium formicaceticum]
MEIVVQKYGGSSLATVEKIKEVANKVIKKKEEGYHVVVIVSAMGKTTDELISLAKGITDHPVPREMDMLLTTGEQISIALLSMALNAKGYSAVSFTGSQLNIQTTSIHQKARIKDIETTKLIEALEENKIVVVAGFQGVTKDNEYTTLGRGGSDTSAVALAAKLGGRCEIYTDVDGIYTMDPRKLKRARKIEKINYEEMMEMASLGAGVMHYRAVELGHKYKIPIYVASTFSEERGTMITNGGDTSMEEILITGMASSLDDIQVTLLNIPSSTSSLYRLFGELAEEEVNVDMISQMLTEDNKMNVSFTIPKTDLHVAEEIVEKWREEDSAIQWEVNTDIAKISVVGLGMRSHSGVAGKVFELMAKNNIEIKMVTTSEIKITWVVDQKDELRAVEVIGSGFGLEMAE